MSCDGLLFSMFSDIHPKYQTPLLATLLSGLLAGKHYDYNCVIYTMIYVCDIYNMRLIYARYYVGDFQPGTVDRHDVNRHAVSVLDRVHLRAGVAVQERLGRGVRDQG